MKVVGVDAHAGGWIAVVLEDGRYAGSLVRRTVAELLAAFRDAEAVAVDIPIGVPDEELGRPADAAAREFVGARRSSVFPTPPRRALLAPTYAEARAIAPSLSSQSYALGKRILEVESLALADERVVEVHPEVSFAQLAGQPLAYSKRTPEGLERRRALLVAAGIQVPPSARHDLLDAAAAAWSADRYARGEALPLPPGHTERTGAIWR